MTALIISKKTGEYVSRISAFGITTSKDTGLSFEMPSQQLRDLLVMWLTEHERLKRVMFPRSGFDMEDFSIVHISNGTVDGSQDLYEYANQLLTQPPQQ